MMELTIVYATLHGLASISPTADSDHAGLIVALKPLQQFSLPAVRSINIECLYCKASMRRKDTTSQSIAKIFWFSKTQASVTRRQHTFLTRQGHLLSERLQTIALLDFCISLNASPYSGADY